MEYIQGRKNLACTVFVPVDCGNRCPFCNTKKMYDDAELGPDSVWKICKTIDTVNRLDYVTEYVVTGGEPSADMTVLKMLVGCMEKKVFINTELPAKNRDEFIRFVNTEDKIAGVSISRHMHKLSMMTDKEILADVSEIDKIEKPVRINSIISEGDSEENIEKLIAVLVYMYGTPDERRMVNLRADYRSVTDGTLKNIDRVSKMLLEKFTYIGSNSCLVCNSMFFSTDDSRRICWHRGLEKSSAVYGNKCYVNDIIIDLDGHPYRDWDMQTDDEFLKEIYTDAHENLL